MQINRQPNLRLVRILIAAASLFYVTISSPSTERLSPRLGLPPASLPETHVAELVKFFAAHPPYIRGCLDDKRTCEAGEGCKEIALPGYQTIAPGPERPMRCIYHVVSASPSAKIPGIKRATADLIFPTPTRMARWIIDSCLWAGGNDLTDCIAFLKTGPTGILDQSSAQFPISGIVFEDMQPGLMKGYAFRDGLTAKVPGWANGSEASPTPEQTRAGLTAEPSWLSQHARVARADIGDVKCLDPSAPFDADHPDDRWRAYVRTTFVDALQGDHNFLLLAQVFAHYHRSACARN